MHRLENQCAGNAPEIIKAAQSLERSEHGSKNVLTNRTGRGRQCRGATRRSRGATG